jgi:putative MATE family efflux protein
MLDLTVGSERKQIFRFAIPMLLGNVFQQLYNIVDSIIIGQYLGKEALAAVGASFPLIFVLISLIIGIASGSTIIVAQYFGAKDMTNVKKSIDTLFVFLFFAAIAVTILGIAFSDLVFRLIQIPEDVLPQAKTYLTIYLSGIILFIGFNGISEVLRGLGDSKTPLYFLIIATLMNVILDILFIVVFKMGVAGAAVATIISQGGAFITAMIYLNRTHEFIRFSLSDIHFDREIFRQSVRIGLPSGFQQTFVSFGMLALLRIVNKYGTSTLAAYTVAGRIDMFAGLPAMNFGAALSTFVGQNMGANKPERIKKGFQATLLMTTVVSVLVSLGVIIFSRQLMSLFTTDTLVIEKGRLYLLIVSSFYVVFSFMFVSNGALRGAGDTFIPMIISLFALWVIRIPLSYFFSISMGEIGIWWGVPAGWVFGAVFSYIYYKMGKWKTKGVIKYPLVEE